jgi:predicted outer membrane repeat protein
MNNILKSWVTIFVPLIGLAFSAKAETFVSGVVSAKTTWSLAGSPYIVTANVAIPTGATLTIESGTTVLFRTGTSLLVLQGGTICAKGTSGSPVLFQLDHDLAGASGGGIVISAGAIPTTVENETNYVSGSIIDNCVFRNMKRSSGNGGAVSTAVAVLISNSLFESNTTAGSGGSIAIDSANCVISNCKFSSNVAAGKGGAIYTSANIKILSSKFTDNRAESGGGALCANSPNVSLEVFGSVFNSNVSRQTGGAIHAGADFGSDSGSSPRVISSRTVYSNNTATAGGAIMSFGRDPRVYTTDDTYSLNKATGTDAGGGAIWSGWGSFNWGYSYPSGFLQSTRTKFTSNRAEYRGGAVCINAAQAATVILDFCELEGNSSGENGGAVYLRTGGYYGYDLTLTVSSSIVKNNFCGGYGGALYAFKASSGFNNTTIINSTFLQNNSPSKGGAIYTETGTDATSDVKVSSASFYGNKASVQGGALWLSQAKVSSCVFLANESLSGEGIAVYSPIELNIENSLFAKNVGLTGAAVCGKVSGSSNLFVDNKSLYDVRLTSGGTSLQDLSNNYWGAKSGSDIASKIYDFFDDPNFNTYTAVYQPFRNTPHLVDFSAIGPILAPKNVTKYVSNGVVMLNWQANLDSNVTGYKVYYGSPTGYSFSNVVDVGGATNYILTGVPVSELIGITAYDDQSNGHNDQIAGHESWFTPAVEVATFSLVTGTLGNGKITLNPLKDRYLSNEVIQVTAYPETGFVFWNWSNASSASTASTSIVMDRNKTLVANFKPLINFTAISNKTYGDAPFEINATASSGLPVNFRVLSGPATIVGNTITVNGAGKVSVRAEQGGDNELSAAIPVEQSFNIDKASQTIAFDTLDNRTLGVQLLPLTASSSSGLPVDFSIVSGPAAVLGKFLILTGKGLVTVRASQSGDGNYKAAVSVEQSFNATPVSMRVMYGDRLQISLNPSGTTTPENLLAFRLVSGPVGAGVSPDGRVTWKPDLSQAPSTNIFVVAVIVSGREVQFSLQVEVFDLILALNGQNVSGMVRTLPPAEIRLRLSSRPDWILFYTLDGKLPTPESFASAIPYSSVFKLDGPAVVWPLAYSPDFSDSVVGVPVEVRFLEQQTIDWGVLPGLRFGESGELNVTTSSGLPVTLRMVSGPGSLVHSKLTASGVGTLVIRAEQTGTDTFAPVSEERTIQVERALQALNWPVLVDRMFGDAPFGVSVNTSSGLPAVLSVSSGKASVNGTIVTITGASLVTLTASQAGDSNYEPVTESRIFKAAPAAQSINFAPIADKSYSPDVFTPAAMASSKLPVTFKILSGPAEVVGLGLRTTGVGTVTVRAIQAGDDNYNAALPVDRTFEVGPGAQTLTFIPVGSKTFGDSAVTLAATSNRGLEVKFRVLSGPASIDGTVLSLKGAGTVVVQAIQSGTDLYEAATEIQSVAVSKAAQTINFPALPNRGYTTNLLQLKASASSGFPVTFRVVSGLATVSGSDLILTGVGNIAVVADQAGNSNFFAAPSLTNSFNVNDDTAPALVLSRPLDGETRDENFSLEGRVRDDVGVDRLEWRRDQGDWKVISADTNGNIMLSGLKLNPGSNLIDVRAIDAAGNTSILSRTIAWVPLRTLELISGADVQEGQRIKFFLQLSSPGDVGGLTFKLTYNPAFLTDPKVEWSAVVGQSVNSVNTSVAGEVSGSFSLPGTALASGTAALGRVDFRARSVPVQTNVVLSPSIVSLANPSGTLLATGNGAIAGEGRIRPRKINGDNNANQRIDIGDAVVVSRLLVGLEEARIWDVGLNDLNASLSLDNGDVIKALRTVVGLDPQPGPMGDAKRLSPALPMERAPVSTNYSADLALLDGPAIKVGQPYRVAVRLRAGRGNLTGLSFSLRYPASLELKEKVIGAEIPADALPAWNVSGSRAKLAVIRPKSWVAQSGEVVTFTFQPTPEAAKQTKLPISLEEVEVSDASEGLSAVPSVWLEIGGGLEFAPQLRVMRTSAEALSLEILGPKGLPLSLESSEDLSAWSEIQSVSGQGIDAVISVNVTPPESVRAKFWRVTIK